LMDIWAMENVAKTLMNVKDLISTSATRTKGALTLLVHITVLSAGMDLLVTAHNVKISMNAKDHPVSKSVTRKQSVLTPLVLITALVWMDTLVMARIVKT